MNRRMLPLAAFVGCAAIWSSTFLAIRVGNDGFPAVWACTLRLAIAAVALNLIVFSAGRGWPTGRALKAACGYGFLEFGVSLPLLYWGERVVSSGLAAVLYAITPISAMLGAKALGTEDWSRARLVAAVIAVGGVGIIFWRQLSGGGSMVGMLSITGAVCAGSVAPVVLQRGPRQGSMGVNAVGTLVALPMAFLFSVLLGEQHPLPRSPNQYFPILYLALASSVIAFGLFAWLVNHWKVTTVAFLGVIVPVMAVVLGAVFRHEIFEPGAMVGAIVVLAAVAAAIRSEAPSSTGPKPDCSAKNLPFDGA
jgi:drug/metabolite transporter (DMT)-like permease